VKANGDPIARSKKDLRENCARRVLGACRLKVGAVKRKKSCQVFELATGRRGKRPQCLVASGQKGGKRLGTKKSDSGRNIFAMEKKMSISTSSRIEKKKEKGGGGGGERDNPKGGRKPYISKGIVSAPGL